MHYIPLTVLEFSSRFRMGSLSSPKEFLMDELSAAACNEEALRHLCGLFTEESDVVFVGFEGFEHSAPGWISVPSWKVMVLHPVSFEAGMAIVQRLNNMTVGDPVPDDLREKVAAFRNRELADRGHDFLMKHFNITNAGLTGPWRSAWQASIDQYRLDHHFPPASLLDHLVKYERTKMFEKSDIGFLEDTASIAKLSMQLPDGYVPGDGFGDNSHFDGVYGLLKQVAILRSGYIRLGNFSMVRLLREVAKEPVFNELNSRIEPGIDSSVNTFAMMMIYLKFRSLIREINSDQGEENFRRTVISMMELLPDEAVIALSLAGMRFGIHQFSIMFSKPDMMINSRYFSVLKEKSEEVAQDTERTYHYGETHRTHGYGENRQPYHRAKKQPPTGPVKPASAKKSNITGSPVQLKMFDDQQYVPEAPIKPKRQVRGRK